MTQEQGHRRRSTRADRNRPVLVTSSRESESETTLDEPEFEQIETVEDCGFPLYRSQTHHARPAAVDSPTAAGGMHR